MNTAGQVSTLVGCLVGGIAVFLIIHFVSHWRRRRKLDAKLKLRPMEIKVPQGKENNMQRLGSARNSLQRQNIPGNYIAPTDDAQKNDLQIPRPSKISYNPAGRATNPQGRSRSLPRQSIDANPNHIEMKELSSDKLSRQNSLAKDYSMKPLPRPNFQRSQSEIHKGVRNYFQRNSLATLSSRERHTSSLQYFEESEVKDASDANACLLQDRGRRSIATMRHSYSAS